jgi:hypothetical protein
MVRNQALAPAFKLEDGIVKDAAMTDIKSFVIGGLLVAVVVLGYLYWDRQRNTVEIKLPSITIEKR